ncbi:hypothetical protein [Paenibacillus tyrfis]|uniref:hypothetical protein n=1 Tax=Paenibacillus tyrfis TaxID=1501230 RepID=UPI00209D0856|nr:hypothetical protein [Paenibacillus tyrfis]MCP1307460.1 hypothetical protein [Paenibacillus tyrfis]
MQDVFDYIERHQDEYIRWLQALCRQPSVAAQNRGMAETAKMVEGLIREIGGHAKRIDTSGYPVVYGEFANGKKKTLSF